MLWRRSPMSALPFSSSLTQAVRWLTLALSTLALVACESQPAGSPVPAPRLVVGDHWTYKDTDNVRRGIVSTLDADVSSINGGVATVRLALTNAQGATIMWDQEMDANGGLIIGVLKPSEVETRRFPKPIALFDFPLTAGTTWRQAINTISPETGLDAQILVFGRVLGPSQVTVPAGTFTAVYAGQQGAGTRNARCAVHRERRAGRRGRAHGIDGARAYLVPPGKRLGIG